MKCNKPIEGESPDVSIGDKVLVKAQIHAPGHYIERWRSPIPRDRSTIEAIAVKITQISSGRGNISFEKFRQLTTGMTEVEVRLGAGKPAQLYYGTCDEAQRVRGAGNWECWTHYYDGWVAYLTSESGRVVKIESLRCP